MSLKVTTRVAARIIIIIILRDFTANGFLYVFYEFSAVHKGARIYFNIILLTIVSAILWFFVELMVCDQIYIIHIIRVLIFSIYKVRRMISIYYDESEVI